MSRGNANEGNPVTEITGELRTRRRGAIKMSMIRQQQHANAEAL